MQQYYNQPVMQPQSQSNGLGVAGFVCAILAIVLCWVPFLGLILWLLGLIFSIIGMCRQPRGLAIAGFVISLLGLIIGIIATLVFGAALMAL